MARPGPSGVRPSLPQCQIVPTRQVFGTNVSPVLIRTAAATAIIPPDEFVHVSPQNKVRFELDKKEVQSILTRGAFSNPALRHYAPEPPTPPASTPKPRQDSKINVGRNKNAGYYHALSLLGELEDVEMSQEMESVSSLSNAPVGDITSALEGMSMDFYVDDVLVTMEGSKDGTSTKD